MKQKSNLAFDNLQEVNIFQEKNIGSINPLLNFSYLRFASTSGRSIPYAGRANTRSLIRVGPWELYALIFRLENEYVENRWKPFSQLCNIHPSLRGKGGPNIRFLKDLIDYSMVLKIEIIICGLNKMTCYDILFLFLCRLPFFTY